MELSSFSAMFNQLPCLGVNRKSRRRTISRAWLAGWKGFVESAHRVRVEVVADQNHSFRFRIPRAEKFFHFQGPVNFFAMLANMDHPPAREWFGKHKNAGGSRTFVFVIDAASMLPRRWNRNPCFFQQLNRLFVHAQHGPLSLGNDGVRCTVGNRSPARFPCRQRTRCSLPAE